MGATRTCTDCGTSWPLPYELPARIEVLGVPCCAGVVVPVERSEDDVVPGAA